MVNEKGAFCVKIEKGAVDPAMDIQRPQKQTMSAFEVSLRFLGTGSAFSKKYGNTSALLTVTPRGGVSRTLLIDCGRTTPDDLARSGYVWTDIDAIFISHLHGDHIYGLEEAGFMGRYVLNRKPHLILPDAVIAADLWEHVLQGTMQQGGERDLTIDDYFTWETADPDSLAFSFNGLRIRVYRTRHIENKRSYGLIIGDRPNIVYTADTLFDEEQLAAFAAQGSTAIFHDCQLLHFDNQVHTSLDQLETLDASIRARVYLMHYGDNLEQFEQRISGGGFRIATRHQTYQFEVGASPV